MFQPGKMGRGERLEALEERMKTTDPDKSEIYTILGIEQATGIKTNTVFKRVKGQVSKAVKNWKS